MTFLRRTLTLIFIISLSIWCYEKKEELFELTRFNTEIILILSILTIISVFLMGLSNQLAASHLGAPLRTRQWFLLSAFSTLANYIFPMKAGMFFRGTYYNRVANLSITDFINLTAWIYVLSLLINSLAASILLIMTRSGQAFSLAMVLLPFSLFCLLIFIFPGRLKKFHIHKLNTWLDKIASGWHLCSSSQKLTLSVTCTIFLLTFTYSIRMYFAFLPLGESISFFNILLLGFLVSVSGIISLTPGALGFREGAIVLGSSFIGISPELSLLAATLDRIVSFVVISLLGSAGFLILRKSLS